MHAPAAPRPGATQRLRELEGNRAAREEGRDRARVHVAGAGMGAAAFASIAEREIAITGMAGISLDEYTARLCAHLAVGCGLSQCVQQSESELRSRWSQLMSRSNRRLVAQLCVQPRMKDPADQPSQRAQMPGCLARASPDPRAGHSRHNTLKAFRPVVRCFCI